MWICGCVYGFFLTLLLLLPFAIVHLSPDMFFVHAVGLGESTRSVLDPRSIRRGLSGYLPYRQLDRVCSCLCSFWRRMIAALKTSPSCPGIIGSAALRGAAAAAVQINSSSSTCAVRYNLYKYVHRNSRFSIRDKIVLSISLMNNDFTANLSFNERTFLVKSTPWQYSCFVASSAYLLSYRSSHYGYARSRRRASALGCVPLFEYVRPRTGTDGRTSLRAVPCVCIP